MVHAPQVAPLAPIVAAPRHTSVLALFDEFVAEQPEAPMLTYFDRHLGAAEVDTLSDALAVHLVQSGVAGGDRVVLCLQNMPHHVIAQVAIWKVGAVSVPTNPMLRAEELNKIIDDSGAVALVTIDELLDAWGAPIAGRKDLRTIVTTSGRDLQSRNDDRIFGSVAAFDRTPFGATDLLGVLRDNRGRRVPRPELGPDDAAVLTYTSGTTGRPKGAVNTHGNILAGGRMYVDWFELGRDDSVLGIAPLFHVTGLTGHIAAALTAQVPLVLAYRFEPGVVLDLIAEHRPTFTVGAITAFIALMNHPEATPDALASLRVLASGGAPIAPATLDQVQAAFGCYVHNVYGLTESTGAVLAVPMGTRAPVDAESGALSAGVPVFPGSASIVDDDGRVCGPHQVGELLFEGPTVVNEYWRRPDATAEAFDDGKLRTGDVGFFDENGWFFIVDRKKDMIIASGFKVWPREVEDVLYSHGDVREAAVVGVPHPYRGETVKAFVSLKSGSTTTAEELVEYTRGRMAAYKYPREVVVLDDLPKTPTGKFLRRAVREDR